MKTKRNITSNIPLISRKSGHRLVAIDPGMKKIGLASFEGAKLTDYVVKDIPSARLIRDRLLSLEQVLNRYLDEKRPTQIALEKTTFSSATQNGLLVLAYYKILAIARRRRIPVAEYVPISIRKVVCGNGHATKHDVMKVLISKYPELRVFAGTDRRWKERHYFNLFDAIAVGLTHIKRSHRYGERS